MQPRTTSLLIALLTCPACAFEEDDDALEPRETNVSGSGGTVFNTDLMEARALSELAQPMGAPRQGTVLESVTLDGQSFVVDHFDIDNGEIVAFPVEGSPRRGAQLVGSEWTLTSVSNEPTVMRISDYTVIDEVPHYAFEHQWEGAWRNNCAPDAMSKETEKYYARMLTGFVPSPDVIGGIQAAEKTTFIACSNGAVGKAAEWGYYDFAMLENESNGPVETIQGPPDDGHAPDVIDPLLQLELGIRVVRADYCYDGKSATASGTAVDIEDVWGINERAVDVSKLSIEAVWGADKLLCAGQGRKVVKIACSNQIIPPCDQKLTLADHPGGLIMTRIPSSN